jgi:hypothetical protein
MPFPKGQDLLRKEWKNGAPKTNHETYLDNQ